MAHDFSTDSTPAGREILALYNGLREGALSGWNAGDVTDLVGQWFADLGLDLYNTDTNGKA